MRGCARRVLGFTCLHGVGAKGSRAEGGLGARVRALLRRHQCAFTSKLYAAGCSLIPPVKRVRMGANSLLEIDAL